MPLQARLASSDNNPENINHIMFYHRALWKMVVNCKSGMRKDFQPVPMSGLGKI